MDRSRIDIEFIVYADQPEEETARALDGFAEAEVHGVTLFMVGWEGSMSYGIDTVEVFGPEVGEQGASVTQQLRRLVEEIRRRGMRPRLSTSILQYPDDLIEMEPEWFGDGLAAGRRSEFDASYDDRRERPICPRSDGYWDWLKDRYRNLFKAIPDLDGMMILPSEGRCDLWACRCSRCAEMSPSERLLTAIRHAHQAVVQEMGRNLEIRTYLSGWRLGKQPEWWLPLQGRIPEDLTFGFRAQFGDDHYLNPRHPFVSLFQHPHKALVLDLYNEKRGYTNFPCTVSGWMRDRITHAKANGIDHFIGRVNSTFFHPKEGRFVNFNFAAFAALARDADSPDRRLIREWTRDRFSERAAPAVERLLRGCDGIINGSMFVKGLSITSHSFLPESLRRLQYILVDYCGRSNPEAVSRLDRMADDIPSLLEEKDRAIEACEEKLRLLDQVCGDLDPEDHIALKEQLSQLLGFARILREVTLIFFSIRKRERAWSIMERETIRKEIFDSIGRCRKAAEGVYVLKAERAFSLCDEAEALLDRPEVYDMDTSPLFNGFDKKKDSLQSHLSRLEELGVWEKGN